MYSKTIIFKEVHPHTSTFLTKISKQKIHALLDFYKATQ